MSELLQTERSVRLDSLAEIDPEALRESTSPRYKFKYVDISCASNGSLALPSDFIEFADAPSRARKILRDGDVIVSTVRPNLKAFAYCRLADGPYIASTGFAVLRARENVDAYFLLSALLSDDLSKQIESHAVGSNYPAINSSDIRRLKVPAFDPNTQRAIGKVLATIDTAIEHTEALIEKYQHIKAGLMRDLFTRGVIPTGQLRPPREQAPELYQDTAIGWIPREWQYELLDKLTHRGSGHTPNKDHPEYWNGGIKWVSLADSNKLDQLYISDTELEISHKGIVNSSAVLHPAGIVVLSRDAGVGKSAITTEPMAVSQHFMCWKCDQKMDNHFLYYWLQFNKRTFENIAMGSTILTIGLPYFKRLKIACPIELVEQQAIAQRLKASDTRIFAMQDDLAKLRQQKLGLMQDLLTGKVSVQ